MRFTLLDMLVATEPEVRVSKKAISWLRMARMYLKRIALVALIAVIVKVVVWMYTH